MSRYPNSVEVPGRVTYAVSTGLSDRKFGEETTKLDEIRILRRAEVVALTGISKSQIFRLERSGKFPARVKLGARGVGYFWHEVQQYLKELQRKPSATDPLRTWGAEGPPKHVAGAW